MKNDFDAQSKTTAQHEWTQRPVPSVEVAELYGSNEVPIVDVRSPSEFARGHIPGAISIPLFCDKERATVGTLYKTAGEEQAIQTGVDIANRKSDDLLAQIRDHVGPSGFVVHCWRGGMRSHGFAAFCIENGFTVSILTGGYKSFRRFAQQNFARQRNLIVLSGSTGTGKTELLKKLADKGEQTIDLEALAEHKGSSFGGIGQPEQPTTEHFENRLFMQLRTTTTTRPIWVEDESRSIGKIAIPEAFWNQMSAAPSIIVQRPTQERIERLVKEYGHLPVQELNAAISRLRKRLGGLRLQSALSLVETDIGGAVAVVLEYYDKAYSKAIKARQGSGRMTYEPNKESSVNSVEHLLELGRRILASVPT